MKATFLLVALLFTANSFALCGNSKIVLGVNISGFTSEMAYSDGQASFKRGDHVAVYEIETGHSVYLTEGIIEDDTAGNYDVTASNKEGQSISLYHDHETWHFEGLQGSYTMTTGEEVDLSDIKCSYDDLF
jgi:hypothetical protein